MKDKLQILLTGASGSVGFEALKLLIEKRDQFDITVFDIKSRASLKKFSPFKEEIEIIYGDITNDDDIKKACSGKDFVIHLAAIIPPVADDNPELAHRVNTIGTENLVRNLEQFSPKTFLVFSSSISVYGDRLKTPLIKVEDPLTPSEGDEYATTKIKAEEIIRESKLDWSIFRLTAIMGNHKISKLMFHQPLETSLEIATPKDAARAFVNAVDHKKELSKKTYNLGGGENCRIIYKDFLDRSFTIFGLDKPDFPEKTFAEKNFHCGYYQDGNVLENILHFRNDNLESYFSNEKRKVSTLKKAFTSIFKKPIKNYLLKQSEPYTAFIEKDNKMIRHYFENGTQ
jgi:nucleoside-diphosphate-sugar epimerase